MEIDKNDIIGLIQFQVNRSIINLYKDFLINAEELKKQELINEYYYQNIRKRTLDKGNDCIRELNELLEKIRHLLNHEKRNQHQEYNLGALPTTKYSTKPRKDIRD